MKTIIALSAKAKKRSNRSIFLKAFMGRLDEDLVDAFAQGRAKEFVDEFNELRIHLLREMEAKK